MKTDDLIDEVVSLPVEERARLAECVLQTLNAPDAEIDAAWVAEAGRRLEELRGGQVEGIPGEVVFERIRQRLAK